ncbi:MAG: phenylalanine--tRNA ligase subunit beta, partial [Chloroflexota bacterium]|nr:phenylalanine--tRNA ligase subunit beta [Chloroflexota bacterium]
MRVPVSWLQEYIDLDQPVTQLAHLLTIAGLEVTGIEDTGNGWDRVFVGVVERIERVPEADRLVLATVNYGTATLTVVNGAPNIAEGQKVALALEGALLEDVYAETPRKRRLKASKIRGIRSEGMVCSERELGLSSEHEGILVLDDAATVGSTLAEAIGEHILTFDLPNNLAYANSVVGLAREVAAITSGARNDRTVPGLAAPGAATTASVDGEHLAGRYMLQRLDNLVIRPSSPYIQQRLRASGMRAINNVVDVTNYVMLEYGQPLHGFDRDTIRGDVAVRASHGGEAFETLDHQRRLMPTGTIMIADAERAIGIGGIMGGLNSEVTESTTSILLESATFNAIQIRRAARAMGLRTDASARFERGLDPQLAPVALARAVQLLVQEADAVPVGAPFDWFPEPPQRATIELRHAEVKRLLGVDVPPEEMERILRSLEFDVVSEPDRMAVTPPSYRQDVTLPADVVEEIGRIRGYDEIPATLPSGALPVQRSDAAALLERTAREWLAASGLQEVINYDLTSLAALAPFRTLSTGAGPDLWQPVERLVKVRNPLTSEREYLRPSLLPGLLQNVRDNLRHQESVWLYELDRVFVHQGDDLPLEPKRLAMALIGLRRPSSPHLAEGEANLYDSKGVVDGLLAALRVRTNALVAGTERPASVAVEIDGRCAGFIWALDADLLARLEIDRPVVVVELDWETV